MTDIDQMSNIAGSLLQLGSTENTDTATCMAAAGCSTNDGTNRLKWGPVYPQGHLSVAQGFMGQRKASFQGSQTQLYAALENIFNSSWPGPQVWCGNCLPVDIQWGATNEKVKVFGDIADNQISTKLESYNDYFIAVVYQLLRINDVWPLATKPNHPDFTTLTLRVRGGGEILQIDPVAFTGGKNLGPAGCFTGPELSGGETINSRIRIPLTEYHLTCDRLTDDQLCNIMSRPWKCREGTVNCDVAPNLFMEELEGTLMFDTWTLDQTWVPDIVNPKRWQLSCVLKCRQVPQMLGPYPDDCNGANWAIGWNHDYRLPITAPSLDNLGWQFIMMKAGKNWTSAAAFTPHTSCPKPYVPRYAYESFSDLFCSGNSGCEDAIPPEHDCNQECEPSTTGCTGMGDEFQGGSEAGYEELEEAIAQIAYDARHADSRHVMRETQAERQGQTETWADGKESSAYWKGRIADEANEAAELLKEFKERMEKQR